MNDVKAEVRRQIVERPNLPAPAIRRALRVRAGLTQDQLADAIGVSRALIAKYERGGEIYPQRDLANRYADALEVMAEVPA